MWEVRRTMKKLTRILVILSVLIVSACGDYEKGATAYKAGDHSTALSVFHPLAENKGFLSLFYSVEDVINAQSNLGVMYDKGQGVTQDDKTAVKWYALAAEQGNADAQSNLGFMYYKGKGVIQDDAYAHMWWNIAALNGDTNAVKNRDVVAKRMTPPDISTAQKLARECVRKKYKGC